MKKQKKQQLALHKKAISNLDNILFGGIGNASGQNPQGQTDLTVCQRDCPSDIPNPTNKGCQS